MGLWSNGRNALRPARLFFQGGDRGNFMKLIAQSVVAAAMLGAATAFAADSNNFQLRDTADLVRVCSVSPDDAHYLNATGFCHGVLVGAYRYYDSAVKIANRFICPPNPIPSRARVMSEFVKWAA